MEPRMAFIGHSNCLSWRQNIKKLAYADTWWLKWHWKNILSPTLNELQRMKVFLLYLASQLNGLSTVKFEEGRSGQVILTMPLDLIFHLDSNEMTFLCDGEHRGGSLKQLHKQLKQHIVSNPSSAKCISITCTCLQQWMMWSLSPWLSCWGKCEASEYLI